jgi:hypothetical protein
MAASGQGRFYIGYSAKAMQKIKIILKMTYAKIKITSFLSPMAPQ